MENPGGSWLATAKSVEKEPGPWPRNGDCEMMSNAADQIPVRADVIGAWPGENWTCKKKIAPKTIITAPLKAKMAKSLKVLRWTFTRRPRRKNARICGQRSRRIVIPRPAMALIQPPRDEAKYWTRMKRPITNPQSSRRPAFRLWIKRTKTIGSRRLMYPENTFACPMKRPYKR